jgi:hypothetical protein
VLSVLVSTNDGTKYKIAVVNETTGLSYSNEITSNIPVSSTYLAVNSYYSAGGTSAAMGLALASVAIQDNAAENYLTSF